MADRFPRITNSAGHGEGSRHAGQSDPGAEVVNYEGTEDDLVLNFVKSVDYDLDIIFKYVGRGSSRVRNAGLYYLADDDAVKWESDVFVEWHTDAGSTAASGTTVFYESDYSKAFAEGMAHRISTALGIPNRGAKLRTDLAVTNPHKGMKSILVELMFGSNPKDVAKFKAHRDAVVLAAENAELVNRGWPPLPKRPKHMTLLDKKAYKTKVLKVL